MAKKSKDKDNEIPSWIRDLYREDLDRVVRGERPMFFGSMEDEPLRNVYPEYDLLSSGSARLLRTPGRGIGDVLGFAKDKDEPPTLNDINKSIGRAIRGVGNRLPRPIGTLWKGAYDVLTRTPDNGTTAVAAPFMYLINQEENERRKADGEYPLGYVDLVDFVWPSEKYGSPFDIEGKVGMDNGGFVDGRMGEWKYVDGKKYFVPYPDNVPLRRNDRPEYIGGDRNEVRNKYIAIDGKLRDVVTSLADEYGIAPSMLMYSLSREGFIDAAVRRYNDNDGNVRSSVDDPELAGRLHELFGLDDIYTHVKEGKVKLNRDIKMTPTDFKNRKGRTTKSGVVGSARDAIELMAAELRYRQDEVDKDFPDLGQRDRGAYSLMYYNMGVSGGRNRAKEGDIPDKYYPDDMRYLDESPVPELLDRNTLGYSTRIQDMLSSIDRGKIIGMSEGGFVDGNNIPYYLGPDVDSYNSWPDYVWIDEREYPHFVNGPGLIGRLRMSGANFVRRLEDPDRKTIKDWEHPDKVATHKMSWGIDDYGPYVFPVVQDIDGELHDFSDPSYRHEDIDADKSAHDRGDLFRVSTPYEAAWISENYKRFFPFGDRSDIIKMEEGGIYTVKSGDSLSEIAEKYGMPWDSRTREEVMEWEIKHGTRPAASVELPDVDVYQESKNLAENLDRKPDGGEIDFDVLWREDVERRMRGERAVYFPYMNDEPLINEHPEFVLPIGKVSALGSAGVPQGTMGLTARGVLSGINKGIDKAGEFVENNINWPILRRIEPYLEKIYDRLPKKGNSRRNFRWFIKYLNEIDDHGVRFIAPLINSSGDGDEDRDVKSDGGYIPRWTDKDEADFQDWYARVSAYKGLNPDPDDGEQYYDYRSFWKENLGGMADRVLTDDPEAHFTDRYKFPGHPTFSVESIYSNDRTPGGTWEERDGVYYYHPSEYTFGYIGRTLDYLAGSESDGIYLEGEYMMIPSMGDGGAVDTGRPYGKGKYVIDPDRADEGKRNDVYDEIYDYLTEERKFPGTQAVAILANIAAESGGDTAALGSAGDFGIQQWLGPRKKELKRRYGEHPTLKQQLDYLVAEHSGEVPGMGWNYQNQGRFFDKDAQGNDYNYYMYSRNDFLTAKNYKDATIMWNQGFGRPLGSTLRNDVRVRLADRFAKRYGVAEEAPATINLSSSTAGDGGVDNVVSANPSSSPVDQHNPMVDDWWNSEGRDLLYNVMATAGASAKKVEELSSQIKGDEPTAEQVMAMRMEENERNKRRVAMDILLGIRLNVPGMARGN